MALKETFKHMRELLVQITSDLDKAENGNKAASQRVRTGTVRLEKVAKVYRKESIKHERQNKDSKRGSGKKAAAGRGAASKAKTEGAKGNPKNAVNVSKMKAKSKAKMHQTTAKPRALCFKRSTAKMANRKPC